MNETGESAVILTVVVICYNHAATLPRALDSVLCQKTDFRFEVVVIDDCSTDGSQDVIRAYMARDARVKGVFHEENYYSRGRRSFAEYQENIRTPFFHVLESDDYWCDPGKLQLQMDALRTRPGCIACAHAVEIRDAEGRLVRTHGRRVKGGVKVYDIYSTQFCHLNTTLFRNFLDEIPPDDRTFLCRDIFRFYFALTRGKLVYFDRAMSVYCQTGTGVWSSLDESAQTTGLQDLYFQFDRYLGYKYTRKFRHLYLPHEGKRLFSFTIPYFWKGRRLRIGVAKI